MTKHANKKHFQKSMAIILEFLRNFSLHSSHHHKEIIQDILSNHKPTKHFKKQTKISTVFNLSNLNVAYTLSGLLEQGLTCSPSHKLDLVELCHDISDYTSHLLNEEFFTSENSTGTSIRLVNPF